MKKRKYIIFCLVTGISILSACTEEEEKTTTTNKASPGTSQQTINQEATLILKSPIFPISSWKVDNAHVITSSGKLMVGDNPVVGATVQVSDKRSVETDDTGSFTFMVDTSQLKNDIIRVTNVDQATIDGRKVIQSVKDQLLDVQEKVQVYYPISVMKVEDSKKVGYVNVHAKADMKGEETYPPFGPSKYKISGIVKDADGNALDGVTVAMRRDGVEGFAMSKLSDDKGEYELYYLPEDDESHYVNVIYKNVRYTLPENRVFLFPEDISITLDIVLPKEGTLIEDKPPTLVSKTAPGALYKGTLVGVNVGEDVEYTVTIPKKDGTFTVTLPKEEWEKSPTFFETNFNQFMLESKVAGDVLSSKEIGEQKENDPKVIVPLIP